MAVARGTSDGCALAIPGYEIQRLLGAGGMGKVYLARQEALKRPVCVKVLAVPDGEDPVLCHARFHREAELLANLSHPHIVSLFDFGTTADEGLPFLVTEYIEGGDLRGWMTAGKPLSLRKAREIVSQVGEALLYLHGKGIIHRDLKPENILLATESLYKVCDFGLAVLREKSGSLTRSGHGLGTLGYVSPEQQYGLKVDDRTDQYSLAAIAYELLTGRRLLGRFSPPSKWNPQISTEVDQTIMKGLAEQPGERYPIVSDFVTALLPRIASPPRRDRTLKKSLFVPLFSLALGLFVLSAALIATRSRKSEVPGKPPLAAAPPKLLPRTEKRAERSKDEVPAQNTGRSTEFTRMTRLRAYRLWVEQGSPMGEAGEAVKDKNWAEAERQIEREAKERAYSLWEREGRPTGAEGEAVREKNYRTAEVQMLQEMEEAMRRDPVRSLLQGR